MAENSGNWLSNLIKNSLSRTKLSDMLGSNADIASTTELPSQAIVPHLAVPQTPSPQNITSGDELLNFYKQALFGDQKPADIMFGGVPVSFDVAGSTAPAFPGFPGELYTSRLSRYNPKYKPVKR